MNSSCSLWNTELKVARHFGLIYISAFKLDKLGLVIIPKKPSEAMLKRG